MTQIFSPWPSFTQEEADAVSEVLLSNKVNYWTGTRCREFEAAFAEWTRVPHAIALANGTLALDVALRALGVGPGDEVVVTSRTFIASVSSIVLLGAKPVFADVDPDSQNISAESISEVLSDKTKAIICVHLAGWPCDMDDIMELASTNGLKVIEDCAQAHGAKYKNQPVGSIGDVGCWSFCQDKIMTTGGEGGMVTTNSEALWKKMWSFKDHGKSYDAIYNKSHPPGFRWLHTSFGTNYRMTEMQAAIGLIQLRRMSTWTEARQNNAKRIWGTASEYPVFRVPEVPEHIEHAAYKAYIFVRPDELEQGWSRDRMMEEIQRLGVPCFSGSCSEVYQEKAFETGDLRPTAPLPQAQTLGETSLMFLVHPTITESEIQNVCDVIGEVAKMAQKENNH
ncbi:DegT/DnrJ/EryC1/StrS aminotransferase family protein [uncultured Methylophaga sp.]|uniref:DegT/DnrJ/EryC1/StrS family aminotransferase n=1 Tax=uncultured Methylophaga sp. TaxID=285271 RepID=UPI00261785C2|nr:DegT/DnrJ/EryC1/StrS aminotransferase family protein [uncultured Methylophaga sp.]